MSGLKSMRARMSRSMSMPGATSIELEAVGAQRQDAALGDVKHALAAPAGVGAAERDVLDLVDELA